MNYLKHQQEHHKRTTFKEDYKELFKESDIEYDENLFLKHPTNNVSYLTALNRSVGENFLPVLRPIRDFFYTFPGHLPLVF